MGLRTMSRTTAESKHPRLLAMLLVILILLSAYFIILHKPVKTKQAPNYILCMDEMAQLMLSTYYSVGDVNAQVATSWDSVLEHAASRELKPQNFICPEATDRPVEVLNKRISTSFIYIPGSSLDVHPPVIVFYCPPENHQSKWTIVGYSNGTVDRVPFEEFEKQLKDQTINQTDL